MRFMERDITVDFKWPCGLMDKASDFGSEDCRFESCHGRNTCEIFAFLFGKDPDARNSVWRSLTPKVMENVISRKETLAEVNERCPKGSGTLVKYFILLGGYSSYISFPSTQTHLVHLWRDPLLVSMMV